jgi:hypothetical protein
LSGRFVNKLPVAEIPRFFGTDSAFPNDPARFNIAPTEPVLTVRSIPRPRSARSTRPAGLSCRTGPKTPSLAPKQSTPGGDHAGVPRRPQEPALHYPSKRLLGAGKKTGAAKQAYAIVLEGEPLSAFAGALGELGMAVILPRDALSTWPSPRRRRGTFPHAALAITVA